jgi:hypothetical protein
VVLNGNIGIRKKAAITTTTKTAAKTMPMLLLPPGEAGGATNPGGPASLWPHEVQYNEPGWTSFPQLEQKGNLGAQRGRFDIRLGSG